VPRLLPERFCDFLEFESAVFGDSSPIALYDPYLIRYGEYRFILDTIPFRPEQKVLDLGCESNIFMHFLGANDMRVVGVDIDPGAEALVEERRRLVEERTGKRVDVSFVCQDATQLELEPESFDVVVATSSVEHMFSDQGDGDRLAVDSIARALRPGGIAAVTVPMSNGAPFHEAPQGDERFAGPYRLYTPDTLRERIATHPALCCISLSYLTQRTPDRRFPETLFSEFWTGRLSPEARLEWAWANPILAAVFNPISSAEEGERTPNTINTALVALQKNVIDA
jgi:SAM-dependent methyltransferase